jgi:hypothetical protein
VWSRHLWPIVGWVPLTERRGVPARYIGPDQISVPPELGVTTLELDLQITEDGQAVATTHDRKTTRWSARTPRPPSPAARSSPTWASSSRTSPSPRSRRSTAAPGAHRPEHRPLLGNVTIQSFDWGALMRRCQLEPQLPIVALTNGTLLQAGQPGASPWLGGIDIKRLRGSLMRAAKSFSTDAISPLHGDRRAARSSTPATSHSPPRRWSTRHIRPG